MMNLVTKTWILALFCCFASTLPTVAQIQVTLPEHPVLTEVPATWRGFHASATANLSWMENPDFEREFPRLHPGIIRWPQGNGANNFNWRKHLSSGQAFNLKEAAAFLNQYNVEMQIVVNFGNGSAQEAADYVKLCNSNDPFWRNERTVLLDHPDPLNVRFWEIGNEVTTPWGFGWSWLGQQDEIKFRSGEPSKSLSQKTADSLYYYGGSFWREGWVAATGGLDRFQAVLGETRFIGVAKDSSVIKVDFPELDPNDPQSVRAWLTPNFDLEWAENTATQLELYNALTEPANRLDASTLAWDDSTVTVTPIGGISANSALLIEYHSINHDGAFAFRDAMLAADPSIQIGYSTKLKPDLYNEVQFQADFAAHPPHFMIEHPYYTSLTKPAVEKGLFSEAAYLPVFKKEEDYFHDQATWDAREVDWGIPHDVGIAYTEWNIGLCDECPSQHPFDGIAGAVYVASFWANLLDTAIDQSLDIRLITHFSLVASGHNFIHLFTSNNGVFEVNNEAPGARMVLESIGRQIFRINDIQNMPQIILDDGAGGSFATDALQIWGGYDPDTERYTLFLLNRDDEAGHTVNVNLPTGWNINEVAVESLWGTMVDKDWFTSTDQVAVQNNAVPYTLPVYSVTTMVFHQDVHTAMEDGAISVEKPTLYPNPSTGTVILKNLPETAQTPVSVAIYDVLGREVRRLTTRQTHVALDLHQEAQGLYFIRIEAADVPPTVLKVMKRGG